VTAAHDVKTAGFTPEEARRLAWELYPLCLVGRAATEGTAALKPEPAKVEMAAPEPEPAQEPEPPDLAAPPPAPEPDPTANRFTLECWLKQHRPDLLAAIRTAVQECERMYWYAQAGFPEKLAAAEAALAQAVAEGQRVMREALAGREVKPEAAPVKAGWKEMVQGPGVETSLAEQKEMGAGLGTEPTQDSEEEMAFEEVEKIFGGFERIWRLSDAQAAKLERIFLEKGPVVVRSENGRWWSAEEWYADAACQN
jgi:hypothetical protein